MFKYFIRTLKQLTSNSDPGAIACGFSLGILLGFIPKDNLLWAILFIFIFFMRINRVVLSLCIALGALISPLLDPLFDIIGCYLLTLPFMQNGMLKLLEIPFVSFTKINNSVVFGSLVCSIVLYVPLYFLGRLIIFLWRKYLAQGIRKFKVIKVLKKVPLVKKLSDGVN